MMSINPCNRFHLARKWLVVVVVCKVSHFKNHWPIIRDEETEISNTLSNPSRIDDTEQCFICDL